MLASVARAHSSAALGCGVGRAGGATDSGCGSGAVAGAGPIGAEFVTGAGPVGGRPSGTGGGSVGERFGTGGGSVGGRGATIGGDTVGDVEPTVDGATTGVDTGGVVTPCRALGDGSIGFTTAGGFTGDSVPAGVVRVGTGGVDTAWRPVGGVDRAIGVANGGVAAWCTDGKGDGGVAVDGGDFTTPIGADVRTVLCTAGTPPLGGVKNVRLSVSSSSDISSAPGGRRGNRLGSTTRVFA